MKTEITNGRDLQVTFISYAQNHEDVLLYRALKGVGKGFYIDVGANDPEEDSVTKAFYDRGWGKESTSNPCLSIIRFFLKNAPEILIWQ